MSKPKLLIVLQIFYSNLFLSQISLTSIPSKQKYDITLNYELEDNLLVIKPKINNGNYKFIFDTGSPCAVSVELAETMRYKNITEINIGDAYGNKNNTKMINIDSLSLNGFVFHQITAMKEVPQYFYCNKYDGIIGCNLINNSVVSISHKNKTIRITDKITYLNLKDFKVFDLKLDYYGMPFINIKLNNSFNDSVLFDTGGGGDGFTISKNVFNNFQKSVKNHKTIKGKGASRLGFNGIEMVEERLCLKIESFKFCDLSISNIQTVPANFDYSRIGSSFLKYGDVIIDYQNSKFYF